MALSGAGTLSVEDCTASIIHSASYFAVIATTADAPTSLIRLAYASALFQYRLATIAVTSFVFTAAQVDGTVHLSFNKTQQWGLSRGSSRHRAGGAPPRSRFYWRELDFLFRMFAIVPAFGIWISAHGE